MTAPGQPNDGPQGLDTPPPAQKRAKRAPDWELFERFWRAYPKKKGKEQARRAWRKLDPDMDLCRAMSAALEKDKRSRAWRKNGGEFIPYPATWLRGRRWEDEHEPAAQETPSSAPLRGEGVDYA